MSLPRNRGQLTLLDTPFILRDFIRPDEPYGVFREKIYPALRRKQASFDALYSATMGREAIDPVIMAGVTLLQFMEKAGDAKAASQVRLNIGWKHALNLMVDYEGFHPTSLHYFRDRLLEHDAERTVFDALHEALREAGLIRKQCKQRLDSTHVLGCIKSMSRLENVRETMRLCLQAIEDAERHDAFQRWTEFREKYIETKIDWRDQGKDEMDRKFIRTGHDCQTLIEWLDGQDAALKEHAKAELLRRVFSEQYTVNEDEAEEKKSGKKKGKSGKEGQAMTGEEPDTKMPSTSAAKAEMSEGVPGEDKAEAEQRKKSLTPEERGNAASPSGTEAGPEPQEEGTDAHAQETEGPVQEDGSSDGLKKRRKSPGAVCNPHDPDAQWSAKGPNGSKPWQGYKAQIAETVADDPTPKKKGEPTEQYITEITTTEAIASDLDGMARTQRAEEEHGQLPPTELFVDSNYVSDDTLFEQQQRGTKLVGPARPSPQHHKGYASDRFNILNNGTAICPAGKASKHRCLINDRTAETPYYRYEWGVQCDTCDQQKQCNSRKDGRRELVVGRYHILLQERRKEMKTEAFKERMKQRAGVEGTVSEGKRGCGLGRTRYKGLQKTSLANYMIGAACNASRWIRRAIWETKNAERN